MHLPGLGQCSLASLHILTLLKHPLCLPDLRPIKSSHTALCKELPPHSHTGCTALGNPKVS